MMHPRNPRTYAVPLAGLAIVSIALAGCVGSDSPSGPRPGAPNAAIQVVNGATAPLAVRVDGQLVVQSLAPGEVSQPLGVRDGSHMVALESAAASGTASVQLDSGTVRVVTATGAEGSLDARLLPDTAAFPAPGTVKLRVVHLAGDAPPLSVWRTQPEVEGPHQVMFPFPYGSESSYLQGEPGGWRVWVAPLTAVPGTGTDTTVYAGGPTPELASSGPITLRAGDVRTAVLLRTATGGLRFEVLAGEP